MCIYHVAPWPVPVFKVPSRAPLSFFTIAHLTRWPSTGFAIQHLASVDSTAPSAEEPRSHI